MVNLANHANETAARRLRFRISFNNGHLSPTVVFSRDGRGLGTTALRLAGNGNMGDIGG